jgi:hypothetical protein
LPLGNSASTLPFPLENEGEEALEVAAAGDDVEEATEVLLGVGVVVGVVGAGVEDVEEVVEEDVEEVVGFGFSTNTAALTELEVATGVEDGMDTAEVEGAGGGAGVALWIVPPTMTYLPDLIPA